MTAPSSIDPARFLHEHLAQASPDLMRQMLTTFINSVLSADADAVCGAAWGEVSDDRIDRRNGYRHRDLDTRVGTLGVASRSCARARTSRTGCSSGAAAPRPH